MKIKRFSFALVFIELLMIFLILLTGPLVAQKTPLLLLEILGAGLGLWAVITMFRQSRYGLFVEIGPRVKLVTTGPYHFIHHPMYTSILLMVLALIWNYPTLTRIIFGLVLLADLIFKIKLEEKLLIKHFGEDYLNYQKKTNHLIPFIY